MGKTEDGEETARWIRQNKAIFVLHHIVIDHERDHCDDAERQEGEKDLDPVDREQPSTQRAQARRNPAIVEPRAIGECGGHPGQEHERLAASDRPKLRWVTCASTLYGMWSTKIVNRANPRQKSIVSIRACELIGRSACFAPDLRSTRILPH